MRDLAARKNDPTLGEYLFALALVGLLVAMIAGLWAMAFDDPPPIPAPTKAQKQAPAAPAPVKDKPAKRT
jgi:hypothetical protein